MINSSSIGSNSNSSSSSHNNNNNFTEKTRENNSTEKFREIAQKINLKSTVGVEPTQDTIRKAFEAQLIAGKNKLKKVEDEVGQVAKPPPAPVPPPPPPPVLPSYHHTVSVKISRKKLVKSKISFSFSMFVECLLQICFFPTYF